MSTDLPERVDVAVVGAGISGLMIARELSKYELEVLVVEKNPDIGFGVSKGHAGIIHALQLPFGSVKARMCVEGNRLYDLIAEELGVRLERTKMYLLALTMVEAVAAPLVTLYLRLKGVKSRLIRGSKLRDREPILSEKVKAAVEIEGYAVIEAFELLSALYENAVENGVKFAFNTEVVGVEVEGGRIKAVITNRGRVETRYLINAAGLEADRVAELAGDGFYRIIPGKGVMLVFGEHGYTSYLYSRLPLRMDPHTKGGGALYTIDSHPLWGPNLRFTSSKSDTSTGPEDVKQVLEKFTPLFKRPPRKPLIAYAGVRPIAGHRDDFIVEASKRVKGLIHVAGIDSPGLTAAPAIARRIIEILVESGERLKVKKHWNPRRRRPIRVRELTGDALDRAVEENPGYGKILCRCMMVSEGEIVDAIRRGATTLDGVKFRTHAMMGECQGSKCTRKILSILSRELGVRLEDIVKNVEGSKLVVKVVRQ